VAVPRPARGAPGQHFLRSSRLAEELVRDAAVAAGERVVEIGAGTGVLTRALARTGAEVIALELDPALASALRRRFAGAPNVTVVEADALRWRWPTGAFAVVANLPFARSGALLARLLGDPVAGPERAHVIVQWELAAKHASVWPTTQRGAYWRAWYELAIAGRLSRTAFTPPPSVDAAVLRAARRVTPLVPPEQAGAYWTFLSDAFRRGELRRLVPPLRVKRLAPVLGFAPHARPRELDARQLAALFVKR
jgi:23S rRNA (adenine-N6)-dimethyltransferase